MCYLFDIRADNHLYILTLINSLSEIASVGAFTGHSAGFGRIMDSRKPSAVMRHSKEMWRAASLKRTDMGLGVFYLETQY